jgi:succinate dehydrogenase iron-sulfur subunit
MAKADKRDTPIARPSPQTGAPSLRARHSLRSLRLKIRRQNGPDLVRTRRWEEFEVERAPGLSVAGALLQVRERPVTADGRDVAPVAFEGDCFAEACGACTMLVNGQARPACTTSLDAASPKGKPIVLEPLGKFPVVRDLVVDRSQLFDALRRVQAFVEIDDSRARVAAVRQSPNAQARLHALGLCTSCGACLEACPQYGEQTEFVGAAALNQVARANLHPNGTHGARARLEALMEPGGVADCGKAQNCVEVCPAAIPLVDSIQRVARDTSRRLLFGWLLD